MTNPYRTRTTQELIQQYADEKDRIDKKDAKLTQDLIKKELTRRFNTVLSLLDDRQTYDNPDGTFQYLLGK